MNVADGMAIVSTDNLGNERVVHIRKVWANRAAFTIQEEGYTGTYSTETGNRRGQQSLFGPTMRNLAEGETEDDVEKRRVAKREAAEARRTAKAETEAETRRQAIERNKGTEPFKLMTADPKKDVTVLTVFDRTDTMHTVYYVETAEQGYDYDKGENYPTTVARFAALDHGTTGKENPWNKGEIVVRQGDNIAHALFVKLW